MLYIVGGIADTYGIRTGLLIMVPIFLIGAWILVVGVAVREVRHQPGVDVDRRAGRGAAQAQQGVVKLLVVRNLDVHYDNVQVLFGVDFEVDEGEIVALLGTNGAGKSTLLKAISGLVEATNGAVVFDGRDMTYAPPNEVAERGVVDGAGRPGRVPDADRRREPRGSRAGCTARTRRASTAATEHVLELFPILARAARRARRQPLRRPAADARARHGVHRASRAC